MSVRLLILSLIIFFACDTVTGINDFNFNKSSDSNFSKEKRDLFKRNASILAFRDQMKKDSSFIEISQDLEHFYYDLQVTVANSQAGQEHSVSSSTWIFEYFALDGISALPNSQQPFVENWSDSIITTNIPEIDELLADNGFEISRVYNFSWNDGPNFAISSPEYYNTFFISKLLEQTGRFEHVHPNYFAGDGSNIIVDIKDKFLEISYTIAYGDCPAGCINEDFYTFRVTKSGEVSYLGKNINR